MSPRRRNDVLFAVLAMMFLSGAAALIYEVVWLRVLARSFGVTVHAVSALVSLYMLGLALGAAAAARMKGPRDWLKLYAWLEAGAGLTALAATHLMKGLPGLVSSLGGEEPLSSVVRVALAAPLIIPPTALLGATLPALTRFWTAAVPEEAGGAAQAGVGRLYGANTMGAMVGLLLAGFWTIGEWGETATVGVAAALNLAAAGLAFYFSGRGSSAPAAEARGEASPSSRTAASGKTRLVLALFAVSGFCALGYEILWSRQLILLLGNSTYAFTMVLAVYLLGIGLGSHLSARVSSDGEPPLKTFGLIELFLAAAAAASLASFRFIGTSMDAPAYLYSPLSSTGDLFVMAAQALAMIGPAALLMGLLFPLAARLCAAGAAGAGTSVGRVYAWNTVGGIFGSFAAGFWGMSLLGAHGSFMLLIALNAAAGLAALGAAGVLTPGRFDRRAAGVLAALLVLCGYAWKDPTLEIIEGRLRRAQASGYEVLFHEESPAATITGVTFNASQRTLLVNGIDTAGTGDAGTIMAVLPDAFLDAPRSALVICFGAGNTFRTASQLAGTDPGRRVDVVDLVAAIPRRMPHYYPDAAAHFGAAGRRVFIEDGRQFLLRAKSRWDSIIVDASPPLYSAGTVNLYTTEFFDLVRGRLTPDGIFTLWLPLLSFEDDYWGILRGMTEVFPHVSVWYHPGLSGFLVFGGAKEFAWPRGELERRLRARAKPGMPAGIDESFIRSHFVLDERDLRGWLKGRAAITDDRPTVEFPLKRFLRREPMMGNARFLLKARPR
jgi:spermidine synthase